MASTSTPGKDNTDASRRWAALASQNERLAGSAELLLLDLKRDREEANPPLKAASLLRAA